MLIPTHFALNYAYIIFNLSKADMFWFYVGAGYWLLLCACYWAFGFELLGPAIALDACEVFDVLDCYLVLEFGSWVLYPYLEFDGFIDIVCIVGLPWSYLEDTPLLSATEDTEQRDKKQNKK